MLQQPIVKSCTNYNINLPKSPNTLHKLKHLLEQNINKFSSITVTRERTHVEKTLLMFILYTANENIVRAKLYYKSIIEINNFVLNLL